MPLIEKVVVDANDRTPIAGATIATKVNWTEGVEWQPLNTAPVVNGILRALPGYLDGGSGLTADAVLAKVEAGEGRETFLSAPADVRRALVTHAVVENCHAARTGSEPDDSGLGALIEEILSDG